MNEEEYELVVTDIEYSESEEDYDSMEEKEFCVKFFYEFILMADNEDDALRQAKQMMFNYWDDPEEINVEEI